MSASAASSSHRRVPRGLAPLAIAAAVALSLGGVVAPARADDGNVSLGVMVASGDFFGMADGQTEPPGVFEIFDANGDGTTPLMTVPTTGETLGDDHWVNLPDGQYRMRASIDGYLPTWAGMAADGGADSADQPFGELIDGYFGFSTPLTFDTAPVLDISAADETTDRPARIVALVSHSTAYIGGVVFADASSADAQVELYRVGQGTPIMSEATDRSTYVFDNVPAGNYQLRFVHEGAEQWWPFVSTRAQAAVLNMPAAGGAWAALDGAFSTAATAAPSDDVVIVGDPVAGGVLSIDANLPAPFDAPELSADGVAGLEGVSEATWFVDGVPVPGVTGTSFVVPASAVGAMITATATVYQLLGYNYGTTEVGAVGPVVASTVPEVSPAPVPVLLADPVLGVRLDTDVTGWQAGSTRTFQWNRDGVPLAGATARTYVPKGTDVGGTLTLTVTATRPGSQTTVRTSAPSLPVAGSVFTTPSATLKTDRMAATPRVGDSMRAVHGAWGPAAEVWSYQWYRDGSPIDGATGEYYDVTIDDLGASLSAEITGARLGYETVTVATAASGVVTEGIFVAPRPVITPAPQVGVELSVDLGAWSPVAETVSYQWMRGTTVLGTGSSYTPTPADANRNLRVTVTGSAPGYLDVTRSSVAIAVLP